MRRIAFFLTLLVSGALACGQAYGQGFVHVPPGGPGCWPPAPLYPSAPSAATPSPARTPEGGQPGAQGAQPQAPADAATPPNADAFNQPPPAGGAEAASFNPAMFGDLIGGPSMRVVIHQPNGATVLASVPVVGRGAFKIAENESPRPQDRVFAFYQYFDRVTTSAPGNPSAPFDLHREVIGFEKTFLEGNASFGMRLPFLQLDNGPGNGIDNTQIGDLSMILKWALLNDRLTGNVFSVGMVVTAPTGDPFIRVNGQSIHPTILQPYLGYIWNRGNFYVHGFESLVVPTSEADVTLLLSDFGIGYRFMFQDAQDRFVKGIVPTLEGHLIDPLNHRGHGGMDGIGHVQDWFTVTAGAYAIFTRNSTFGFAIGVPVTGPRPYNLEALTSLNVRF